MRKFVLVVFAFISLSGCSHSRHIVYLTDNKDFDINKPDIEKEHFNNGFYGKNVIYVNELCKGRGFKQAKAFMNTLSSVSYRTRVVGLQNTRLSMYNTHSFSYGIRGTGGTLNITKIWCE